MNSDMPVATKSRGRGRPSGTKKTTVASKVTPNEMQEPRVVELKDRMQTVRDSKKASTPKEKEAKKESKPKVAREISAHEKIMDKISQVAMKNKKDLASLTKRLDAVLKKIS